VERFAQVGEALAGAGWAVVVTGAAEEAELAASLARCMRAPVLDFAGRTSLGGLAQLIARAALIVCNDTGVSHVAAAVGTPSVVVCCGADPERWAPLDRARHRVLYHPVDCRPCMHSICPVGHGCALGVEVGAVVDEAMALLVRRDGVAVMEAWLR
jgi:ADP-heptose:LPS heptosyltransferase